MAQILNQCNFTFTNLNINNNSKKGFKNIKGKKRYIKNNEVFVLLKKQNLVSEARKYPEICSVENIDKLSDKLIRLKRFDMLEKLKSQLPSTRHWKNHYQLRHWKNHHQLRH